MNNFITILTVLYSAGGIISFLGYIPTIISLQKKKESANIITYFIWILTSFITLLYGIFVLNNTIFNTIITLQLLACIVILFLSIRLKIITKNIKNGS